LGRAKKPGPTSLIKNKVFLGRQHGFTISPLEFARADEVIESREMSAFGLGGHARCNTCTKVRRLQLHGCEKKEWAREPSDFPSHYKG
jgi:hypothetical protein